MFDGLTKSKFYTKCKSLTKMTKTRVEALKKKKNAVAKYLKNDMADLIRSDLDYNAYCRAEGLLVEQNMIACYNFLEQFCGCISSNLSLMSKQKECPEECKEAVQSLIYAAARFSEFPELRDLRTLFTERYGTSLESFINKEFVEILRLKSATKEMKLQLMHKIAQEFSIEWNAKSLEQKLFQPPPSQQDQHRHGLINNTDDDGYKWKKNNDYTVPKRGAQEDDDSKGYKWKNNEDDALEKRDDSCDARNKMDDVPGVHTLVKRDDASTKRDDSHDARNKMDDMWGEHTLAKTDGWDFASHGRKDSTVDRHRTQSSSEDEVFSVSRGGSTDIDSLQASSSSVGSVSEDEVDSKKPFSYRFIPPPYVKPKIEKQESKIKELPKLTGYTSIEETSQHDDMIGEAKPTPRSVRRRPLKPPPGRENLGLIERPLKLPPGHETFGSVERPLKLPPGREKIGSVESDGSSRTNSSAVKPEEARQGFKFWQADDADERDEEEKIMDGLLMHYSKRDFPYEPIQLNSSLKPPPSWQKNDDIGEAAKRRNTISELPLHPGRKLAEPATPTEAGKRHVRAVSVQPEMLSGHVHPNLPDCDELAARIAAFKGR